MGSTWGKYLKISVFGESHGKGVGVVIDGFPAGLKLDMDHILFEMARRAPGKKLTTNRKEADFPNILSGVTEDVTTGAPIAMMIENSDTRSGDYQNLKDHPRPGHSDYAGQLRYDGYNDLRGGGHFSGRLTAPMVFAGALCKQYLKVHHGVEVGSHILQIGSVMDTPFDLVNIAPSLLEGLQQENHPVINPGALTDMLKEVDDARMAQDSVGGIVECGITGMDAGIGSPIFDTVESRLASFLYAIPAVKGVSFGSGFGLVQMRGSEANDAFVKTVEGIRTKSNHNGGILGGITTGMPIVFQAAFKPTASIGKKQNTLNLETGAESVLVVKGRHDPCITLRAPVVVEAAAAITLLDLKLEAYGYDAR